MTLLSFWSTNASLCAIYINKVFLDFKKQQQKNPQNFCPAPLPGSLPGCGSLPGVRPAWAAVASSGSPQPGQGVGWIRRARRCCCRRLGRASRRRGATGGSCSRGCGGCSRRASRWGTGGGGIGRAGLGVGVRAEGAGAGHEVKGSWAGSCEGGAVLGERK